VLVKVLARTGHELEVEAFGITTRSKDFRNFLANHSDSDWPLPVCLEHAKRNQKTGWNPVTPPTDLMFTLYYSVKKHLLYLTEGNPAVRMLGLFVTVGQPADYFWGVDCFFDLDGRVATIDITMRPDKPGHKAQFLFRRVDITCRPSRRALAERIARHLLAQSQPKS